MTGVALFLSGVSGQLNPKKAITIVSASLTKPVRAQNIRTRKAGNIGCIVHGMSPPRKLLKQLIKISPIQKQSPSLMHLRHLRYPRH